MQIRRGLVDEWGKANIAGGNGKFSRTDFNKAKPGTYVTRLTRFAGSPNFRSG